MSKQDIFTPADWERITKKISANPLPFPDSPFLSKSLRDYIWDRDWGLCVYCKEPGMDCEHVIPTSHNGPDIKENIVVACRSCNVIKSSSFRIDFLTIAFNHLLFRGESLDWIEKIFLKEEDDEYIRTPVETYQRRIDRCPICSRKTYNNEFCSDNCEEIFTAKSFCPVCKNPIQNEDEFCSRTCANIEKRNQFCFMCFRPVFEYDETCCSWECKQDFEEEFGIDPETGEDIELELEEEP